MKYLRAEALRAFASQTLQNYKLQADDANTVAESLVLADLRGISSHGLIRLPIYCNRLEAGLINPSPNFAIVTERPASLLIDGDHGMGQIVTKYAMEKVIQKTKSEGTACVGVKNSNHFGAAAFYVVQALAEGIIPIVLSNAPAVMPVWGGTERRLGTNPFAFGAPADKHRDIIVDMATSVAPRGKIIAAAARGVAIPQGWAIDSAGASTTDAKAALDGLILPFGGVKGYALSLMIDMLSGLLTGSAFGNQVRDLYNDFDEPQKVGHFIYAVDINSFMPLEAFTRKIDQMIELVKQSKRQPGISEIFLPGEIEANLAEERLVHGIPLEESTCRALRKLGAANGISFPV